MASIIHDIKQRIRGHFHGRISRQERLLLEGAFLDIEHLYAGQARISGVPVVMHSLRVALLLAESGAGIHSTIAGLLHDVLEDTMISRRELQNAYGPWCAGMSEALKKTTNIQLTHEKLVQASQNDDRSFLIKFCDRLDNMREIVWLPEHKRRRISRESLQFYLPLASRFRIPADMRDELTSIARRFH